MITIPNYQITKIIHKSKTTIVYRGTRNSDNFPIIIKMSNKEYSDYVDMENYKKEYDIIRGLNKDDVGNIIETCDFGEYKNKLFIVLEDIGGKPLTECFTKPLEMEEFFPVAIRLANILSEMHKTEKGKIEVKEKIGVIHKDINPNNIIFNAQTKQLRLIDFGIAITESRENPILRKPTQLEGTLAFISPEQTGRINCMLDCRTDFYSLGVTFYWLLTNQLPFETTDDMELIHCHIAKMPRSPRHLNANIYHIVSDIVMKLLKKSVDERYRCGGGLGTDLQKCWFALNNESKITPFVLGEKDIPEKFFLPLKLYGREREIKSLQKAVDETSTGKTEMILITGEAGVGKSVLVKEIHKSIVEKHGYLISGKADQQQHNTPYAIFINAFADLARQLLSENDEQIRKWRDKILQTVDSYNMQLIIEMIPGIKLIVGDKQPQEINFATSLLGMASQNRFNQIFKQFIKIFIPPGQMLAIFLDDLQWADSASLRLIQFLTESEDIQALFLIAAYRDKEINANNSLSIKLKDIEKYKKIDITKISLSSLKLEHTNQLIADMLYCNLGKAKPLGQLVHIKTKGNPLFIHEFLNLLYTKEFLKFEHGNWEYDLKRINGEGFTNNNIIELLVNSIKTLSSETQEILKLAACIGNQFSPDILQKISDKTLPEVKTNLFEAIRKDLLTTIFKPDQLVNDNTTSYNFLENYAFIHDRIRQAFYSIISDEQKPEYHLKIGRSLKVGQSDEKIENNIFDIVYHFGMGKSLITSKEERNELAKLNLLAGQKANTSLAYRLAFNYFKTGIELLSKDSWQTKPNLTLKLYEESANAAYLKGQFEQMEQWIEIVLIQPEVEVLDKITVYEIRIQAYQAQEKSEQALKTGLEILGLLGIEFQNIPSLPNKFHLWKRLLKLKFALSGKKYDDLLNLPKMTEPRYIAAMRIMSKITIAAYFTKPKLFPLLVFEQIVLSAKYGMSKHSILAYAWYGKLLCETGKIDAGYNLGKTVIKLLEQSDYKEELKAEIFFIFNNFVVHWKQHTKKTLKYLLEAYESGKKTGDLEFGGYSGVVYSFNSFITGEKNLVELEKEMYLYGKKFKQLNQTRHLQFNGLYRQNLLNLINFSKKPEVLIGEAYDETERLSTVWKSNDKNAKCRFYITKLRLCYLFYEYGSAAKNANKAKENLKSVGGLPSIPIFYFYDSLTKLSLCHNVSKYVKLQYLAKVWLNQRKMKKWAYHAPMNYQHKYDLVEAEICRIKGKVEKAMYLYDRAIDSARANGYVNEEALSYELAANFYFSIKKDKIAQVYLQDAHYAYKCWGAEAKVKHLEKCHHKFFDNPKPALCPTSFSSTNFHPQMMLDLKSLYRTSQIIMDETDLGNLLKRLMKTILVNTGAERGILFLERNDQLFIEAEMADNMDEAILLQSIPQWSEKGYQIPFPNTLINRVKHTKETIVLDDAAKTGQFIDDQYIVEYKVKSVLCVPLISQTQLAGILYLENNLISKAFTTERIQTLKILSAQIVMAIKNALAQQEILDIKIAHKKEIADLSK
ncbi:AAA family ATPase [Thiotrichales bacterium HSG1]|nr:AAA family ATPase [Thiotrichales bacterium HSG1]